MRDFSDRQLSRIGVCAVVVAVVALAAAINLQKLPGLRGTEYAAEFSDASGLEKGGMVQIAGIPVGRISSIDIAEDHAVVNFSLDPGVEVGSESTASVKVLNVLGVKYLDLISQGGDTLSAGEVIPRSRTSASYDVIKVFDELTDTTENIDLPQLETALDVVAGTMNRSSKEAAAAFDGLSRLSSTIASRDAELQQLLRHARRVTTVLAHRKGDLVEIMREGDLLLGELSRRREAIHTLLVNTRVLAQQIGGLVADNQEQLGPMLEELHEVTALLNEREQALRQSVKNLGPFVSILGNIVGSGPWFDAILPNFLGLFAGEFVPEPNP
jgi:phospholipid/cholesterol/gamma-HCH transport system substrate-binding protein